MQMFADIEECERREEMKNSLGGSRASTQDTVKIWELWSSTMKKDT